MKNPLAAFTPAELRKLRSFKDPHGVQRFLDDTPYHLADTAWSPRRVLREQASHCLEGAIFAAAAFRALGFPPLIIDFEATNDTDHVLAIYRVKGHWGAVAKSNYTGCRYREPVYRTVGKWLKGVFPVSTGLIVQGLAKPEYLMEIDVIAEIPSPPGDDVSR